MMSTWRYTTSPAVVKMVDRKDNARRRDYKRQWEREHDFAVCACGNKTSSKRTPRCDACRLAELRRGREAKDALVEDLWAADVPMKDIARALNTTVNSLGGRIHRLRKQGRAPYRHTYPRAAA
jgi:hypothetical protein